MKSSDYHKKKHVFEVAKKRGSPTWTSIYKALDLLKDEFQFKFGSGNTNFWFNAWLLKTRISEFVWAVDIHDNHLKIKGVFCDGVWEYLIYIRPF